MIIYLFIYFVLQNMVCILYANYNQYIDSQNLGIRINTSCLKFTHDQYSLLIKNCLALENENQKDIQLNIEEYIKQSSPDLKYLSVINANLRTLLETNGQTKNLQSLDLSNNLITVLEPKCFSNLNKLEKLILDRNHITALQDGVFDSLIQLKYLSLNSNQISYIGLDVFSNDKYLNNLLNILFDGNLLRTIDSWPLKRVQNYNGTKINFNGNYITQFTNKLNFTFSCSKMGNKYFELIFEHNWIDHYLDFTNMSSNRLIDLHCLLNKTQSRGVLRFSGNSFICDCFEFEMLTYYHDFDEYKDTSFEYLNCNSPKSLDGIKYTYVSLEKLICNVPCMPGCKCFKQPFNQTFHILCPSNNMTFLPKILPPTNQPTTSPAFYKLDFSGNKFSSLYNKSYFLNETIWLDLRDCELTDISADFWLSIKNIKHINLKSNRLTTLPTIIQSEPGNFNFLDISKNKLSCSCPNKWFQEWLKNNSKRIIFSQSLLCDNPLVLKDRSVMSIKDNEFCPRSTNLTFEIIGIIIASFAIILFLRIAYVYRVRHHVMFEIDEYEDKEMHNDIFISASSDDSQIAISFLKRLEDKGFTVVYHDRDFEPGRAIFENISDAINFSRRTLFLVTQNFLASEYCLSEFDLAYRTNMTSKKNRLIVMLMMRLEELQETLNLHDLLKNYIATHTYIDYVILEENAAFMQLLRAMPVTPLKSQVSAQ